MSIQLFNFNKKNLDKSAIVYQDEVISYSQLLTHSITISNLIKTLGNADRIGICIGNEPLFVASLLGVYEIEGSAVFFKSDSKPAELQQQLTNLQVKYILTSKTTGTLIEQLPFSPQLIHQITDSVFGDFFIWQLTTVATEEAPPPLINNPLDKEFIVLFTSGVSGISRIVSRSYANIQQELLGHFDAFAYTENDKFICPVPVFHSYGLIHAVMSSLQANACLYLFPQFIPSQILQVIDSSKATVLIGVPFIYDLLNQVEDTSKFQLRSLRVCQSGTAKINIDVARSFQKRYGVSINQMYGSSETGAVSVNLLKDDFNDVLSVGQPLKGISIVLVDAKGARVSVGEEGEMKIVSKAIMKGYLNDEKRNKEVLKDGGYFPGDIGRFDKQGNLYIVGRKSSFINVAGRKVDPFEIEQVLQTIKEIQECAVVGVPHAQTENLIVAGIVLNQPLDESAILKVCAARLTNYKIPNTIFFLESLPKTAVGKILKDQLKNQFINFLANSSPKAASAAYIKQLVNAEPTKRALLIRKKLLEYIQATLYVEDVKKTNLNLKRSPLDYDLTSIRMIGLVHEINEYFGTTVPVGQVLNRKDFESILNLLEKAIHQQLLENRNVPSVTDFSLSSRYPLSEGQKGLWVIQEATPQTTVYNTPIAFTLTKPVEISIIYEAVEKLLSTHPILRVTFGVNSEDGTLFQEVHPAKGRLQRDVQELKSTQELIPCFEQLLHQPFDLSKEVLRLHIRIDKKTNNIYGLFVFHHIITDATSSAQFTKELVLLLNQLPLSATPIVNHCQDRAYFEFINREVSYLKSKQSSLDLAYWKQRLKESTTKLPLPYDAMSKQKTPQAGIESIALNDTALAALKAASKKYKVNLSIFLLAVFKVLLYRLSGAEDLIVKLPLVHRPGQKYTQSIGYYVNILLARTKVSGKQSFASLLDLINKDFINSIDHANYPYTTLLSELNLTAGERNLQFPVSFNYLNFLDNAHSEQENTGVVLMNTFRQSITDEYTLEIIHEKDKLAIQLKYRKDLFLAKTIQQHLSYYQEILSSVIQDVHTPICQIPLLKETQKQQLLINFNATTTNYPLNATIIDLFLAQVEKTPNKIAVSFQSQTLSYQELDALSNGLALHLQSFYTSIEQNTPQVISEEQVIIPVIMTQSVEVLISFLAILKVGAIIAPISPNWPKKLIQEVLTSLEHSITLVNEGISSSLSDLQVVGKQMIVADQVKPVKTFEAAKLSATDSVYLIHTSGSTGKPKGVIVPYQGLMNRLYWMNDYFGVAAAESVLQTTKHVFDSAMWQFFWPLINGGKVVMPEADKIINLSYLNKQIAKNAITLTDFVPSLFEEVVRELTDKKPTLHTLQHIIIGGEKINKESTFLFIKNYPQIKVSNLYGPTEASIGCIAYEVNNTNRPIIPIGQPIANVQVYIVDKALQPVPIGVAGELLLGGVCLAKGYINEPVLTAQKFIPHPFKKSGRVYKTGDLASWLPDGNIKFLGRIDHQLKIRGYRIEVGQIEQVLSTHAAIQQVVVTGYTPFGKQEKELVAYLVAKKETVLPTTATLRKYLAEQLPAYMIPSYFEELESLPQTNSGKVNRKALPAPSRTMPATNYVAARSPLEQNLVIVWEEVLERTSISIDDNFFSIGGHSLRAIRLNSLISKTFKIELPLAVIFQYPTIAALAQQLEQRDLLPANAGMLLSKKGKRTIFAFADIVGLGLVFQPVAALIKDAAIYTFDFVRKEDRLSKYYQEIKTQQAIGPYTLIGYSAGGNLAFEMAKFLEAKGEIVEQLILLDSYVQLENQTISSAKIGDEIQRILLNISQADSLSTIHTLFKEPSIRKQITDTMSTYIQYHNQLLTTGAIKGDIYLIRSEEVSINLDTRPLWKNHTRGSFHSYQGYGGHFGLLKTPHSLKNTSIVNGILENVKSDAGYVKI